KLSSYFTTIGGASAPLVKGTTVTWWKDAPVEVVELVPESRIVLRWDGGTGEDEARYKTLVEMNFKPLEDGGTLVTTPFSRRWRIIAAAKSSICSRMAPEPRGPFARRFRRWIAVR
ncbi:SRPBCC domain-containing protein, partial [Rhizobium ruizarguesonis]